MASKAIGFLNFKFGADLRGFDKAMKKASKKLKRFGKNIQRTGKSLTMGLTLPLVALGTASIKAFDAQEKAIAQVEAGLKSTGNQVGITSAKLQQMAKDLQETTLFGDEEILQGATAQLLTFTNIVGEQFGRTQVMVLDLATRLDGDLKSASIMLGKALNDPVANLSALSRAGIQFSTEQKSLIKSLVETNQLAEAQNIILEELEKQYGGSAEAAALAGMGPIKQLQNQLSDLSEQIGKRLIPFVKDFVSWITKLATKFDGLSSKQKDNIVKWGLILAAIGPVLIIFGKLATGVGGLISAFRVLSTFLSTNPYVALAAVVIALSVAIYKVVGALNRQYDSQKNVNELTKEAGNRIADDITKIQLLTATIQDENTTLADKKSALTELKNLYPGYYDEVDEATFSQDTMAESTERLKKQLLGLANIEVFTDRIKEINRELYDLSQSAGEADFATRALTFVGTKFAAGSLLGPMGAVTSSIVGAYEVATGTFAKELQVNIDSKEVIALNDELTDLTQRVVGLQQEFKVITPKKTQHNLGNYIDELEDNVDKGAKVVKKAVDDFTLTGGMGEVLLPLEFVLPDITENVRTPWQEFTEAASLSMDVLGSELETFWEDYMVGAKSAIDAVTTLLGSQAEKQTRIFENEKKTRENLLDEEYEKEKKRLEKTIVDEEQLRDAISQLDDDYASNKEDLSEEMDLMDKDLKTQQAKREKKMGILSATISGVEAVMSALASVPPPANLIFASIVAGMAAANVATIASTPIPVFAEGGLVTGPTVGLIGEVSSASNPEVVSPLNKLKQFMSGEKIEVVGKLIGNDIYLSNRKTEFNRIRTA